MQMKQKMNQSVYKGIGLLELFTVDQKEMTLGEISIKAGMTKPTTYRFLIALTEKGFIRRIEYSEQDIRYSLGLELLKLGNIVSEQMDLRNIALPHMKKLKDEIEEIVHLVVVDGSQATYIEKVESNQALRLYTDIGKSSPLYAGSGPKLLFAYLLESEKDRIINASELKPLTKSTCVDKNKLRDELQQIHSRGYSISNGEQDMDTIGISYPVRDVKGEVVAALTVSGPSTRFNGEKKSLIHKQTDKAAKEVSKSMGYER